MLSTPPQTLSLNSLPSRSPSQSSSNIGRHVSKRLVQRSLAAAAVVLSIGFTGAQAVPGKSSEPVRRETLGKSLIAQAAPARTARTKVAQNAVNRAQLASAFLLPMIELRNQLPEQNPAADFARSLGRGMVQIAQAMHAATPAVAPSVPATPAMSIARPALSGTLEHRLRVLRMEVTAYCPCPRCCGPAAHGITASGEPVSYNGGRFVAADTAALPFHTQIVIPGYNADQPVEVMDRGSAIKGNRIDLFFGSHQEALEWGRRWVDVTIVE